MKINCTVKKPGFNPNTGLDLVPGEMDVSPASAKLLIGAGLAVPKDVSTVTRATADKPSPKKGEGHGKG